MNRSASEERCRPISLISSRLIWRVESPSTSLSKISRCRLPAPELFSDEKPGLPLDGVPLEPASDGLLMRCSLADTAVRQAFGRTAHLLQTRPVHRLARSE